LSGAGGEASFRDNAERAIEISQTLTVAEGSPADPNPIGIILIADTAKIVLISHDGFEQPNKPFAF